MRAFLLAGVIFHITVLIYARLKFNDYLLRGIYWGRCQFPLHLWYFCPNETKILHDSEGVLNFEGLQQIFVNISPFRIKFYEILTDN